MANDEPTIEQQDSQTALDILKKRIDDLELSIGVLNPRNMAGLRTKDLQQATRANLFGDGSDGDVVVSTEITLTRDMFYNNLTVESTGIINTASYRIFVKDQLIKKAGGIIRNNGNNGSNGQDGGDVGQGLGGSGATAVASGSLPGTVAGSNGGKGNYGGSAGDDGISADKSLGSAGSGGGGGGSAGGSYYGFAGGNGGSQTGTVFNIPKSFTSAYYLFDYFPSVAAFTLSAGSGGGGGGGSQTSGNEGGGGGGSGSPGGMIWIAANRIFIEGDSEIQARGGTGGNGGNGTIVGGGGGGGAGGSGGVIMLIYGEKTGTGTLSVAGGAGGTGGTGVNSGASGSTGQTGQTYLIQIQ